MRYFITSAAMVASATFSLAAPLEVVRRSTFEVKQVLATTRMKAVPVQMMKTYSKYARIGAVAPADVVSAAAAAVQNGSVAAVPMWLEKAYVCPVSVGGQLLHLDFDTGSADLWVFSTETPSSQSAGHVRYNPSVSGQKLPGLNWTTAYADTSGASGDVYADKVVIGSVTATSQAVEAATSVSTGFVTNTGSDGLLGLSFSSINKVIPQHQTTFFDTVKDTLAQKVFTVDLKKGTPGTYGFGYIDSSNYTGSITYVPVDTSKGLWQFTASGYSVGSKATSGSIGSSIADTGTSILYLPFNTVDDYYAPVRGAYYDANYGLYSFSCLASLPDFNVVIGGTTFTVPGSYINYAPFLGDNSTCIGGIQYNTGFGFSIFGDVFLKAVFAIFDETKTSPMLGFAKKS